MRSPAGVFDRFGLIDSYRCDQQDGLKSLAAQEEPKHAEVYTLLEDS